jgi:hypothetical protein
LFFDIVDKVF